MKLSIGILTLLLLLKGPGDIARINTLKLEAKKAYQSGDLKTAITKYRYLVDSLGVKEDEVMMNLSNAYFKSNDTTNAPPSYQPLTQSSDSKIKSLANMQLGVLANRRGASEEALNYFKQAVKAAPDNDLARYNYEMVKKKLEEKKKQDEKKDQNKDPKDNKDKKDQDKKDDKKDQKDKKDQEKKDQDKKDQEKKDQDKKDQEKKDQEKKDQDKKDPKDKKDDKSKEQKDKEEKEKKDKEQQDKNNKDKDKKDIPPSVSDKLKDMQMSEQKAKMILEAMKNQEVQYLQQNKRKATKPRENGKPDW